MNDLLLGKHLIPAIFTAPGRIGSDAGFNYVETNERIDRSLRALPDGMERPKVVRASATDIPAFFLDVSAGEVSDERFIELSRFVRDVLVRRV